MAKSVKPVWQMLCECAHDLPSPFTRKQVLDWFRHRYPDVREVTVSAHLASHCCVNAPGPTIHAVVYRVGHGIYVPVEQAPNGPPTDCPQVPPESPPPIPPEVPPPRKDGLPQLVAFMEQQQVLVREQQEQITQMAGQLGFLQSENGQLKEQVKLLQAPPDKPAPQRRWWRRVWRWGR